MSPPQSAAGLGTPAGRQGARAWESAQFWPESHVGPLLSVESGRSLATTPQLPEFVSSDDEISADELYHRGEFREAIRRYGEALRLRPSSADLHFKLGCATHALEDLENAERHYLTAITINPQHAPAHDALARLSLDMDRTAFALKHTAAALALEPRNPEFVTSRAAALEQSGDAATAWELLAPLVSGASMPARAAGLYARLAPRMGQEEQASKVLERLLTAADTSPAQRSHLHFVAAGLLDRMGRYDEAFEHARRGNQLRNRPHDPAITAARVDRQIRQCTRAHLRALPHATHGSRRPVFIVGMPRSGTSLVEQILASHPQVHGAGELPDIPRIVDAISQRTGYPECLDTLSFNTFNRLAKQYLSVLEGVSAAATYVTDKLPLNCLYLDLIQLLFPDCRVIHCVRDPLDTCLSCYMTDFAEGNGFTCDLKHLGQFHRQYQRLMNHWREVLTLPMLEVRYEQLVADTETHARRLLEFLGLPWDPRCLSFHQNKRPVITASREQVRQPIYGSSVGRWKNYESHLAELIAELNSNSKSV